MEHAQKRRRGTVIVEGTQGILLAETRSGMILLPGGQAERDESRFEAAIRELREGTELVASCALTLFEYASQSNNHRVVWVLASGVPQPHDDAIALHYCMPTKLATFLKMSPATRTILEQFWAYKQQHATIFATLKMAHQTLVD